MPSDLVAIRIEEAAKKLNKLIMNSGLEGKARETVALLTFSQAAMSTDSTSSFGEC
jgi:hypothetical protein